MKKVLMMLSLLVVMGLSADEEWGLACSKEELSELNFGEVIVSGSSASYVSASLPDTAKVDSKNKIIKVWMLYVATPEGRSGKIEDFGQNYRNYGYTKMLKVINLKKNETEILSYTNYKCNGIVLDANDQPLGRQAIVPNSIDETAIKDLRNKLKI